MLASKYQQIGLSVKKHIGATLPYTISWKYWPLVQFGSCSLVVLKKNCSKNLFHCVPPQGKLFKKCRLGVVMYNQLSSVFVRISLKQVIFSLGPGCGVYMGSSCLIAVSLPHSYSSPIKLSMLKVSIKLKYILNSRVNCNY